MLNNRERLKRRISLTKTHNGFWFYMWAVLHGDLWRE